MEKLEKVNQEQEEKQVGWKKILSIVTSIVLVICVLLCALLMYQTIKGETPNLFGYRMYHVMTGSMEPTIETGANVIVKIVDGDTLEVGDVITFTSSDSAIAGQANTHRIIEITEDEAGNLCFVTMGDANPWADEDYVYPEDVLGKVVFHTNAIQLFSLYFEFLHTIQGLFVSIILPLMLVSYMFMRDFVKGVNEVLKEQVEAEAKGEGNYEVVEEKERKSGTTE